MRQSIFHTLSRINGGIYLDKQYYDNKFNEIPKDVLEKAIKIVQDEYPDEQKKEILGLIADKGLVEWALEFHMFWGMGVRNLLRGKGLKDDLLPDQNWDDYYIQVVEAAVGARPYEV